MRPQFQTLGKLITFYSHPGYKGPELPCRLDPTQFVVPGSDAALMSARRMSSGWSTEGAEVLNEDPQRKTPEARGGIQTFMDPAAAEAAYFLGHILATEARDILASAHPGDFVVYYDPKSGNRILLSYVLEAGGVGHSAIECVAQKGVRLVSAPDSGKIFRAASQLIATLCGPQSTALGGPLTMPPLDRVHGEQWMHPRATRDQSNFLMMGQPNGTFIVRTGQGDEPKRPIITYSHNSKAYHTSIDCTGGSYCVEGSTRKFPTVRDLIMFYCDNDSGGDLPTPQLVVSTDPLLQGGLVLRPRWLQLGVSKTEALEQVNILTEGSFVIRSSSVDASLVLSYAHSFAIVSGGIMQFQTPGRITTYGTLLHHVLTRVAPHHA